MNIFLDLIYSLYALFYFPVLRSKGKYHSGFDMRQGRWSNEDIDDVRGDNNVWIHAVSVGEVRVIEEVIRKIRSQFPQYRIILSTVTKTGFDLAKDVFKDVPEIKVIYSPLDFSSVVNKYISYIQPKVYIAAETEIWPNLFSGLSRKKVPIAMINGRISDKSYKNYKMITWVLKKVLPLVDVMCMQSSVDRERIISLGAKADKVKVLGNLKFDRDFTVGEYSRKSLHINESARVWIAASTHPGEEELILDVYRLLQVDYPDLRLIIAPRHTERAENVCGVIESKGYGARRLSVRVEEPGRGIEVIVVDTIGDLAALFNLADIVFMGKSLVPGGGQNMIEPAALAKPVIVGPHTENFRDVMRIFLKDQAILEVKDAKQLQDRIIMLMNDEEKRRKIGEAAQNVCKNNRGAGEQTFLELKPLLEAASS